MTGDISKSTQKKNNKRDSGGNCDVDNTSIKNEVLFSIIMPTYNSENTIEKVLKSIRNQSLPHETIEILVIDGGSTDRTLEIAEQYDVRILKNSKRFPEYAKRIGFAEAKGRWIVMEDSDEMLMDKDQLKKRKEFFENNPNVYCMVNDKYIPGENCGIACSYLNWFGDPFSYIVYKLSDSRVESEKEKLFLSTKTGNIYYYGEEDVTPIGDGGTGTIDIIKAKELFGDEYFTQEFAVSIFSRMVSKTQYVGCIPNDNIVHYSVAGFFAYLKKLQFKVYTNLKDVRQSGYSVRAANNTKLRKRKVLFILYVITLVLPLVDSIRMAVKYKSPSLLLHCVYTYYVAIIIVVGVIKKTLGIEVSNIAYGK